MKPFRLTRSRTVFVFCALAVFGICGGFGLRYVLTSDTACSLLSSDTSKNSTDSAATIWASPIDAAQITAAFKSAKQEKVEDIRGLIVNHHLLGNSLIADSLTAVQTQPERVILLSPNHFSYGTGQIITTTASWDTAFGRLPADSEIITALAEKDVTIDPRIYPNEHGVTNLIPFIKHAFPKASIIPLAIRYGTPQEMLDRLAEYLAPLIDDRTLIITSVDFSHELTSLQAWFHDQQAIATITNLDLQGTDRMDVDSKEAVYVMLSLMQQIGARRFTLFQNTNASILTGKENMTDVTSYITGAFMPGDQAPTKTITLLAAGDMMLDRYVRKSIAANGFDSYFEQSPRFWSGTDITLANLEGCFTDNPPSPLDPNDLTFTFDPSLISTLVKNQFNVLNLANNHSYNFGSDGFEQCKTYISQAAIDYFGHPLNRTDRTLITTIRGTRVGFVGYNALENTPLQNILDDVVELKEKTDYVVVTAHWGNEYQRFPTSTQKSQAHQFIDAGADVVFGAHPHVMQPIEAYKGKIIFYSLGNFIFDQYFSEETKQGLLVGTVFSTDGIRYTLFPISNDGFTLTFLSGNERDTVLADLSEDSEVSDSIQQELRKGIISNE